MADENGLDEGSDPIDEEDRGQGTRRVRPLFRFGRKKDVNGDRDGGNGEPPPGEDPHERVRPVRVVKFVPEAQQEERAPLAEVDSGDLDAAFEEEDEEPAFVVEAEAPFAEVPEEAPFAEVPEEAPFAELLEEEPLTLEEEAPFVMEEGEQAFFEDGTAGEAPFAEVEAVPEVPFAELEDMDREDPVHDTASFGEEAETAEEFEFRAEETPAEFEEEAPPGAHVDAEEAKPHYHKYLKPDEELLQQKQARGRPTGFDRDLDADAGEIDFGIDLIDPSERKKGKRTPKGSKEAKLKKSTTGGHDFDGEVGTRELGVDIGVDYQKRRKRRL